MLAWAKWWLNFMAANEQLEKPRSVEELIYAAESIACAQAPQPADFEPVMTITPLELQTLEDAFMDDGPLGYSITKNPEEDVSVITTLFGVRLIVEPPYGEI